MEPDDKMSRFSGRRPLIRRILLLYQPSRARGWIYHLLFYFLAFILVPFMMMVGFGAYIGPDRSLQGIPVALFLVVLCVIVHRRAVYFGGELISGPPLTAERRPPATLPFTTQNPPQSRPLIGYGLSLWGTVLVLIGFMGTGLFANGVFWLIISVVGFDKLSQLGGPQGTEAAVDLSAQQLAFLTSGPWLAAISLFAIVLGIPISIYGSSQGMRMLKRGRRMRSRDARAILMKSGKPPVLLLRSFGDEDLADPRPMSFFQRRYEESLVSALEPLGPVISIGRPGDRTGFGGSARLYVSDEHWQDAIRHLMKTAVAVIIIVARTQGLWWEIGTALKAVQRQRLLFVFPYVDKSGAHRTRFGDFKEFIARWNLTRGRYRRMVNERAVRYEDFRTRMSNMMDFELPPKLDKALFMDFSPEGKLRLIKAKSGIIATLQSLLLLKPRFLKVRISIGRSLRPFVTKLLHRP